MSSAQKIIQAAAGNAAGEATYVEDVFSTYLYEGTGDNQTNTVTNGLDLAGEGGMVWTKGRDIAYSPIIFDSERGLETFLYTSATSAEENQDARSNMSFNSDGYSFGSTSATSWGPINEGNYNFVSWTFRKAPKFFDVVTYTGNGVAGREIAHNLGSVPGTIIIKSTNQARKWPVYHRSVGAGKILKLNATDAVESNSSYWQTAPTSTVFTLENDRDVNFDTYEYVAYLFAHNDGDGIFGETGDQDIIKCGSFTGSTTSVDLGFEPQWVLVKNVDTVYYSEWRIYDVMRGMSETASENLKANASDAAEADNPLVTAYATGFKGDFSLGGITNSDNFIYIAIRRGPMKTPESGTEVFSPNIGTDTTDWTFDAGFPVDLHWYKERTGSNVFLFDRLRGHKYLTSNTTNAETAFTADFDYMNYVDVASSTSNGWMLWNFRRAPGFFDVVAYTGDGVAGRTVAHNLGVVPEMLVVKKRSSSAQWEVYTEATGPTKRMGFDSTDAAQTSSLKWNNTSPTNSVFTLGTSGETNGSGATYIAYLFASVPGVSKVGSYTADASGNVASINLGFVPRFVLIKSTTDTTSWLVYDTARGIPDGDDPVLTLNTTAAEPFNPGDRIDLTATGFELEPNSGSVSEANETYIYLAIA